MRRSAFTPILALLLAATLSTASTAFPKSADDYYHGAAYQYVAGKIQEAAAEAEEGLRRHPDDTKLRALAEQLRKMQDKQKGNPGNDKNPDKRQDKDQNQGQEKGQGDPDEKKNGNDGKKKPNDPSQQDRQGQQGKPDDPEDPKAPPRGSGPNPDAPHPEKMSERDAERLLNSFADDEKKEQAERRRVVRPRSGTEQDW